MTVFSTCIDTKKLVATIELSLSEGRMTHSFSIIPGHTADVFDFRVFEYYYFLYNGVATKTRYSNASISFDEDSLEDATTLKICVASSKGTIDVIIPYDEKIRALMYECASIYLNFHLNKHPGLTPQIFVNLLKEDGKKFNSG